MSETDSKPQAHMWDLRIKISDDFDDFNINSFDESLREEIQADIEAGKIQPYWIQIQYALPGRWEEICGLGDSLHTAGFEGVYSTAEEISDEQLRAAVVELLEEASVQMTSVPGYKALQNLRRMALHVATQCPADSEVPYDWNDDGLAMEMAGVVNDEATLL